MVTPAPGNTPSPGIKEKAQNFIQSVKAGKKPDLVEPLTPEIEEAVEAGLNGIDEENKAKIRAALVELKKDTLLSRESREGSLSGLFEGAKSDLMKNAPKLIDALIDPELDSWNPKPTPTQRENIKLALIDRIVSGAASQTLFSSLRGKLDTIAEKFSSLTKGIGKGSISDQADSLGKKADEISKLFDFGDDNNSGDEGGIEGKIKKQVEAILTGSLKVLKEVYEKDPTQRDALFSNPKALADYKPGDNIENLIANSGNGELMRMGYKEAIKSKILALESSILSAEAKKNTVMDFLAKTPEFLRDRIFGLLEWIGKIPFLSDIIAAFFGYNSGKKLIENLKLESKERRTILELREFGMRKNDAGILEKGSENGQIKLVENIDWSDADFSKMKPFYQLLRKEGIKFPIENFWKIVFLSGKFEYEVDGKKKTLLFPTWDSRFDISAEKIIEKLNTQTRVQADVPPVATAPDSAPAPKTAGAPPSGAEGAVSPPPKAENPPGASATTETQKTGGRPTVAPPTQAPTITTQVPPAVVAAGSKVSTNPTGSKETPEQLRTKSLMESFSKATELPIPFGNGEQVAFSNNLLSIGNQSYKVVGMSGTRKADITGIKFGATSKIPDAVEFVHAFSFIKKSYQERGDVLEGLPTILALKPNTTVEIPDASKREKMIAEYQGKGANATEEERDFINNPSYLVVTRTV